MKRGLIIGVITLLLMSCATTGGGGSKSSEYRITRADLSTAAKNNYDLGTSYINSYNFGPAEEKLMKVVQLEPNFPDVYNALGVLQERQGKLSDASALFSKAISLDPYYEVAVSNYTRLVCKVEGAASLANTAHGAQGTVQAGMYSGAAECANHHKQYREAINYADSGSAIDPNYPTLYYHKAVAQSALGDNQSALRSLDQYHNLKGYTYESAKLGERSAKLANNAEQANKYRNIIVRQFGNTRSN